MQNEPNRKPNAFKKLLRDKGYYIVLILCVAAVGVSGYLFVRTAADRNRAELEAAPSLSVPLTPSGSKSSRPAASSTEESGTDGESRLPDASEDAAETIAPEPVETPAAATPALEPVVTTVRPLAGDTIADYSVDALSYNETTRDWRTHNGVDIAAAAGTQVAAARDGTVSAIYADSTLGTTVTIAHDGGYTTCYSNLGEEIPVAVGQSVRAGDILGAVGSTAISELAEASHLHFAVTLGGEPVDPAEFLAG